MALELAAFDLLPRDLPAFARGFSAALIATSFCYPLDTLRYVAWFTHDRYALCGGAVSEPHA